MTTGPQRADFMLLPSVDLPPLVQPRDARMVLKWVGLEAQRLGTGAREYLRTTAKYPMTELTEEI